MAEKPKLRKKARPAVGTELRWIKPNESPRDIAFLEAQARFIPGRLTVHGVVDYPASEYGFLIAVAENGVMLTAPSEGETVPRTFSPYWFHYDGEYDTP